MEIRPDELVEIYERLSQESKRALIGRIELYKIIKKIHHQCDKLRDYGHWLEAGAFEGLANQVLDLDSNDASANKTEVMRRLLEATEMMVEEE